MQKHLAHRGGVTEVAVDLERRAEVQQSCRHLIFHLPLENLQGTVAVVKAGPYAAPLGAAPANAPVATRIHGNLEGLRQLGSLQGRDLAAGEKSERIGKMPLQFLGIVDVFGPFLELPPSADLGTEQTRAHRLDLGPVIGVHAKVIGDLDVVGEKVIDQLLLVGVTLGGFAVLGRDAHRADQFPIGPFLEEVLPEFAQLLDHRISPCLEKFLVAGEGVVIPDVLEQPCSVAGHPKIGRATEDPVFRTGRPAAYTVIGFGRIAADRDVGVKPLGVRQETFAEIGGIDKPVVHLHIDIAVVIATPWGAVAIVPDPLEVGREVAGPGGGDHQVTGKLEDQHFQLGIRGAFVGRIVSETIDGLFVIVPFQLLTAPVGNQAAVGGQGALDIRALASIEGNPAVERLVIAHMVGQQIGVSR